MVLNKNLIIFLLIKFPSLNEFKTQIIETKRLQSSLPTFPLIHTGWISAWLEVTLPQQIKTSRDDYVCINMYLRNIIKVSSNITGTLFRRFLKNLFKKVILGLTTICNTKEQYFMHVQHNETTKKPEPAMFTHTSFHKLYHNFLCLEYEGIPLTINSRYRSIFFLE